MNIGILKSKTTAASVALLVLSGVRLWAGDVTGLQGIQEAIMSIVPMLLRSAVYSDAESTKDAIAAAAPAGDVASDVPPMPAGGEG